MSFKLEIVRTETANTYTTTALASTVTLAEYRVDGEEKKTQAGEGCALVLIVDGVQRDLLPGKTYEVESSYVIREVKVYRVGGPSAAPLVRCQGRGEGYLLVPSGTAGGWRQNRRGWLRYRGHRGRRI